MDMIVPQSAVVYVQGQQVDDLRSVALYLRYRARSVYRFTALRITGVIWQYVVCQITLNYSEFVNYMSQV